ncbi:unnamed protein product [Rotaria sp. Silwood2]|nr:unnamed protein product [Rotaria sp. Silwood2]CAF2812186.1 unnamed protein product [Rotaria sp. Silwood2]CAF3526087.1 unnamed protein product [Rotaria sp. Silwood2]CAF4066361.1 unnamed protein product [Rotaria sp. Silwood2]CAF4138434.1 unnamed protein product [Rotaria sp. Silwood2]
MYRFFPPETVVGLSLMGFAGYHTIELFMSRVDIRQFIRLRSLAISNVSDSNLNTILRQITTSSLTSLSISSLMIESEDTAALLSSIIAQTNLEELNMTDDCYELY